MKITEKVALTFLMIGIMAMYHLQEAERAGAATLVAIIAGLVFIFSGNEEEK